ncbi:MAG: acetoacetate--CoA ligase, partial [Solirubrobacterales bacterium]
MTRYADWLRRERGVEAEGYEELWRWSVDELESFWDSIWDYFEVRADGRAEAVLAERVMPGARWFEGTSLNYAEHVFRGKADDEVAVVHASELRELTELRWGELRAAVAEVAEGLRALGVGEGDRVVAYLPNGPEALIAFLAAASLGAIWSSCSPDFGPSSVVDRFAQIEPKALFAVDGYRYGGRDFDRRETVAEIAAQIPSLERVVVVPYLDRSPDLSPLEGCKGGAEPMTWGQLRELGEGGPIRFERVPFDHPLWVLYSSGTTGLPKAIVQGHGGILLEQLKKLNLHVDAREGDRVFWFTTTGWMMWNYLVSGLLTGATIVTFDGDPASPTLEALWGLAEEAEITWFGASAPYFMACRKAGLHPARKFDVSRLRAVGSTGAPLPADGFRWVYEEVGRTVMLSSISGGTDVCSAFVGGCPMVPVIAGEISCRYLGAAVEAFDDSGRSVIGEQGELVITKPMPSMPIGFWGD